MVYFGEKISKYLDKSDAAEESLKKKDDKYRVDLYQNNKLFSISTHFIEFMTIMLHSGNNFI